MISGLNKSPSPEEVINARLAAGLTQEEAAQVVLSDRQAWLRWERDGNMHPGLWELFCLLAPGFAKIKSDQIDLPKTELPRSRRIKSEGENK